MIAITGATGQLGRLVVDDLLRRDVRADDIVAVVREPRKAADLAGHGVQVRRGDYLEPDTLRDALAGVDRLLFISSSEFEERARQHQNVVDAAVAADVGLVAYTSILHADSTSMLLAGDHQTTEAALRDSGLPFAFLRNGWYTGNYVPAVQQALEHGAILGSAGEGRISAATRADYAAAAAAVVAGDGHEGAIYELGGDDAFTMTELAEEVSRQSGRDVVYRDLPVEEYAKVLVDVGMPEPAAMVYADADAAVARGDLFTDSGDLRRLAGRPTTPLADVVARVVEG